MSQKLRVQKGRLSGAWVAPLVKLSLTLDLNSGLDLGVVSLCPTLGSTLGLEPTLKKKKSKKKFRSAEGLRPL